MVYTGPELAAFAKVAGPIFAQRAPNTLMIAPEASIWLHVWSNLSPTNAANGGYNSSDPLGCGCYSNDINDTAALATCASSCTDGEEGYDYGHWLAADSAAWGAFDILGVHEYESQVGYPWPADVNGGVKDKEVWQTEMSGVMYWPEQGPSTNIDNGLAVARWIHSALTVGEASAWLYWWYEAYYQNDNEGLALIQGSNTIAKRYYTMGNFSRYIRPDEFHAVQVAGPSPANVMVSAYKGDNDEVVVVAINETNQAVDVPIAITGGTVPAEMVPYVTSASENWAEGAPVSVTDDSFQAALPAKSVTTFVSN
jgi:O-glycosyl hydrolase